MAAFVGSVFAATHHILRVHNRDGSYTDYVVEQIAGITFKADLNDETTPWSSSSEELSSASEESSGSEVSSGSEESSGSEVSSDSEESSSSVNTSSSSTESSSSVSKVSSSSSKTQSSSSSDKTQSSSSSNKTQSSSSSSKAQSKSSSSGTQGLNFVNNFVRDVRWEPNSKTLVFDSRERGNAVVHVFGPQGKLLISRNVTLVQGYNAVSFAEQKLSRSMYFVRVQIGTKNAILKIQDIK